MACRPRILGAQGNRSDARVFELIDIRLELVPSGRSAFDAGFSEQILGIPDASRGHRIGDTVKRAIHRGGIYRAADAFLHRRIQTLGDVLQLTGIHHIAELLSAALEEHIRRGARVL